MQSMRSQKPRAITAKEFEIADLWARRAAKKYKTRFIRPEDLYQIIFLKIITLIRDIGIKNPKYWQQVVFHEFATLYQREKRRSYVPIAVLPPDFFAVQHDFKIDYEFGRIPPVILSTREKQIIQLLLQGKTYHYIATEMQITLGNLSVYCSRIRKKFKAYWEDTPE